jgi:hypothetical protein
MSLIRAVVSVVSIFLGLSAAVAQQQATTANAPPAAQPPLYQGILVDAKGKNVGRLLGVNVVVREVSGIPVAINVASSGFVPDFDTPQGPAIVFFQSADCTGNGFLEATDVPIRGFVVTNPPTITQPSLVYPGKPATMSIASSRYANDSGHCYPGPYTSIFGPMQTVAVATFGLVPPFTSK